MAELKGIDRKKLQKFSFENLISKDNEIRVIDSFVEMLDLGKLGFVVKGKSKTGRPAFQVTGLLKLYIYCALNRINGCRPMARECKRNIELWWLLEGLKPSYKTISEFRRINHLKLKEIFTQWNLLCKGWGLYGAQEDVKEIIETVAVDGVKIRAQNSKKNNFNKRKVDQQLKYIAKKEIEYLAAQKDEDQAPSSISQSDVGEKLKKISEQKEKYEGLRNELKERAKIGETQISLADEDARSLPSSKVQMEVGYNILTATHGKNSMIADFSVTNRTDEQALFSIALSAKDSLDIEQMIALADKGFYAGDQISACENNGIVTIVSPRKHKKGSDGFFGKNKFHYDPELDCYSCPAGIQMFSTGVEYQRKKLNVISSNPKFKKYRASAESCKTCSLREKCGKFRGGRYVERSENDDALDANNKRVEENKELYKRRQQIVEHPYGTIKRSWGFSYANLSTIPKVEGEFSLVFLAYNLRRSLTIFGVKDLLKKLKLRDV